MQCLRARPVGISVRFQSPFETPRLMGHVIQDAVKAAPSEDSAPPSKVPRTESAAPAASNSDAAAPALSLVEMAMQAGTMAAATAGQPDSSQAQPAAPPVATDASPGAGAQNQNDAMQSPEAPLANVRAHPLHYRDHLCPVSV
jgi:hypothetical protein